MAASLAIQSAYLSTSSFPIVVLTECDVLKDAERAQITEQLEQLIDARDKHVVIVDLTLGAALPDAQRIYLTETLTVRKESVIAKWAGLAIVVGEPMQGKASKAAGWQQLAPVPTELFGTVEAATQWAENLLHPGRASSAVQPAEAARPTRTRPIMTGMPDRSSRQSGAIDVPQSGPRNSISDYLKPPEKDAKKPPAPTTKPAPKDLKAWLKGPRGIGAGVLVLAVALLLLLAPPSDGGLSSAEARSFEAAKSKLALRIRLQRNGRSERLVSGDACSAREKVRFEIDVPANGYILLMRAGADGGLVGVGPYAEQSGAGLVRAGSNIVLPGAYELDPTASKESYFLVGCSEPFAIADCKSAGNGLSCGESCGVVEFVLNKKP